jgi:lysine-N-methylase
MTRRTRSTSAAKSGTAVAATAPARVPDYYEKFQCIGPDCEDSCCIGWRVDIDRDTWQRYQACRHETLAPLIRSAVIPVAEKNRRSARNYANVTMLADGCCPFLQPDRLCMVQKELGPEALSTTCAVFPRSHSRFGEYREYGLDLSCPEAARLILLHPEPIRLVAASADADLGARDVLLYNLVGDPRHIAILDDFRSLILGILQFRKLTLGARMMMLGLLLDEVARVVRSPLYKSSADIVPVLSSFNGLFADAAACEAQFAQIPADTPRKLHAITTFLADFLKNGRPRFVECVLACVDGLLGSDGPEGGNDGGATALARYQHAYEAYYASYFRGKEYILENYLVNEVLTKLFPFMSVRGSYLDQYRTLVLNLAIIQMFLVGMGGHFKGLTDERVIQLIQSFARRSAHDTSYIGKLTEATRSQGGHTMADEMWMLKER